MRPSRPCSLGSGCPVQQSPAVSRGCGGLSGPSRKAATSPLPHSPSCATRHYPRQAQGTHSTWTSGWCIWCWSRAGDPRDAARCSAPGSQ
eukprot:scaffold17720_cov129-Isochrysis_galbana.AAC.5